MEETISIASKPNCAGRRTSAERESLKATVESAEVNPTVERDSQVSGTGEEEVEEKHVPNSPQNSLHIEEFVNLADQHVRFNDAVTVVSYSTQMDNMLTIEPPTPAAPPTPPATPSTGKLFSHNKCVRMFTQ